MKQVPRPVQSVLGAYRSTRSAARMPYPYELAQRSPPLSSRAAGSDGSSARRGYGLTEQTVSASGSDSQSHRYVKAPNGLERQVLSVTRRAGIKSSITHSVDDKSNVQWAGQRFVANMCLKHCWPSDAHGINLKSDMVQEACSQANAAARREGREETPVAKYLIGRVSFRTHTRSRS